MEAAQARAELLRQHAELRGLIEDIWDVAEQATLAATVRDELYGAVCRLADALSRHNHFEEEWLRTLDVKIGAPARGYIDALIEAHVLEHEELHAAVVGIPHMPVKFAGVDVTVLLSGILEHMAREEASLFAEDVAR